MHAAALGRFTTLLCWKRDATPDAESSSLLELFSLPFTSPQPSLLLLLHRLLDFTTNGTPSSCSRSLPLL